MASGHKSYGTGVFESGTVSVAGQSATFRGDTAQLHTYLFFEDGFSAGDVLPIVLDLSCAMFWKPDVSRKYDATVEPAFELVPA